MLHRLSCGKTLGVIVTANLDGLIGYDWQAIWELPGYKGKYDKILNDRLNLLTENGTIVVGRKSYEQLPSLKLPKRELYVLSYLSSEQNYCGSISDIIQKSSSDMVWFVGGASVINWMIDTRMVDIIDLVILKSIWFPPIKDSLSKSKEKSLYLTDIPLFYSVESETQSKESENLICRRYRLRDQDKWGHGF